MSLVLRDCIETDVAYLISTWMHQARKQNSNHRMKDIDYKMDFKLNIVRLLANKESVFVKILCDDNDIDHIIAFVVYSFTIQDQLAIHQIYTKQQSKSHPGFAKLGFAKYMISNIYDLTKPIIALSENRIVNHLISKHPNISFNPFVVLK